MHQEDRGRGRTRERQESREPVPRSRSGVVGRRWERTGDEPVTARSALGLRLLLAAVFTPLFIAGAVLFSLWSASAGPDAAPSAGSLALIAGICAALAVLAALDLLVVVRRLRRERNGRRRG
ncbi:hypothetical protein KBZ10_14140 [Streptomyces sp. F63]|uniref:DUF6343 family protein n=1 Tax=Streptomyces sp. F63 TaxID=2824887 RepID=UPI001B37FF32|nr:DUF6343 family protein [Streptomyces sp. F63]MBQ0985634.1 hypothetical protein [Streptomyces sp. F63]